MTAGVLRRPLLNRGVAVRSNSSRCDVTVAYFSLSFKCLLLINSSNGICDLVNWSFTCWILSFWRNFHSFCFCFSKRSTPGTLLFRSGSVFLSFSSLQAKATHDVKSWAAIWASAPKLVWILGENRIEAKLETALNLWIFLQSPNNF